MKKILNKWQVSLSLKEDFRRMDRGWKIFEFAIVKWTRWPEGMMATKNNYKGFIIRFAIWFPIDRY